MKTLKLTDRQAIQLLSTLRYAYNSYCRNGDNTKVRSTIKQLFAKVQKQL